MTESFNYAQNSISELLVDLNSLIDSSEFSETTNEEIKRAAKNLKEMLILINRISRLCSGEESEDTFYYNIMDDMEELEYSEMSELDF